MENAEKLHASHNTDIFPWLREGAKKNKNKKNKKK